MNNKCNYVLAINFFDERNNGAVLPCSTTYYVTLTRYVTGVTEEDFLDNLAEFLQEHTTVNVDLADNKESAVVFNALTQSPVFLKDVMEGYNYEPLFEKLIANDTYDGVYANNNAYSMRKLWKERVKPVFNALKGMKKQ